MHWALIPTKQTIKNTIVNLSILIDLYFWNTSSDPEKPDMSEISDPTSSQDNDSGIEIIKKTTPIEIQTNTNSNEDDLNAYQKRYGKERDDDNHPLVSKKELRGWYVLEDHPNFFLKNSKKHRK